MPEFQRELAIRTEHAVAELALHDALAMCVAVENVNEESFVWLTAERMEVIRRISPLADELAQRYQIVEDILFL